jgi:quercetin dioxygenase-like cupin family protein
MTSTTAHVLGPAEGSYVQIGGLGVRHMIEADRTGGSFSMVEHPLAPRSLGSPIHTHTHEDEYSYIVEGTIGVQIGDETLEAHAGDLVFKPRGIPHAFWNATDEPARLIELIAPAGFEAYFDEIAALFPEDAPPDLAALPAVAERYGLELQPESIPVLMERHGVQIP